MCQNISIGDWIQIGIAGITGAGIVIALFSTSKQTKILSDQLKLSTFSDYTKRYQEIILHFPEDINSQSFDYTKLEEKIRHETMRYMRAYFDLCSEEFYLSEKNLISKEVWRVWEGGIKSALTKKAFKEAWLNIIRDTVYRENYKSWINSNIK